MTIFCSSKIEIIFMSNLKRNSNSKSISILFFVWIRFEFATTFFLTFFSILNSVCSRLCHMIICHNKIFMTNKFKTVLKNKFWKIFILIFFVSNNSKIKWLITFHFFLLKNFSKNFDNSRRSSSSIRVSIFRNVTFFTLFMFFAFKRSFFNYN